MDEMITKKSTPTMDMEVNTSLQQPSGFHQHLHHHRSTRVLVIILAVVLVILAGLIVWWQFFHKKTAPLPPEETLGQLKASSEPVTSTPQQRAAGLSTAKKDSKQYVFTKTQEMNTLNALKQ